MDKEPPFELTNAILLLVKDITRELGVLAGAKLLPAPIKLRKSNKIRTIHSSLAIEGNTLSVQQVSGILEGKRVIAPQRDIQEVSNAIAVYRDLQVWRATSLPSFLTAHRMLLGQLSDDNGCLRKNAVGVFKGQQVTHVAPPAKRVPQLMKNLFQYLKAKNNIPWLIKACVFHYELEFIHPFSDGNGRMGRLWQQVLLMQEDPIFEFVVVEALIKENQQEYYSILEKCDRLGESSAFVEFSLQQLLSALTAYIQPNVSVVNDMDSRLDFASQSPLMHQWFSRKDYLTLHKNIAAATASRDLLAGVKRGILLKKGDKNQARYQFVFNKT